MTQKTPPTELTEAELDAAAGGYKYKLDGVTIKSFSTSGAAQSQASEQISIGYTEIKQTYKRPD